jgi:polyprenyl-phospho-N-acetylgalactosaminyl synthase
MPDQERLRGALERSFVVVRAYNEAQVLGPVIDDLHRAFPNIVLVNDGSTDATAEIARSLPVHLVTHLVNLGAGAAMQTGLTYALNCGADYIVTFDADGQHRVDDAVALLYELASGKCDVVYGSRFLGRPSIGMPATRRCILKAAAWFSRVTTHARLTDAHNGLRGFTRKAAAGLEISQTGMAYASEITSQLVRHGMTIGEIPVEIVYTDYSLAKGQSSLNSVNILLDLVIGRLLK